MYLKRHLYFKVGYSFSWRKLHHSYTGLLIMAIGFTYLFWLSAPMVWGWLIMGFGLWLFIDDVIQHWLQRQQLLGIKLVRISDILNIDHFSYIKLRGCYDIVTFWHWWPEQIFKEKKFRKYYDKV